MNIKFLFMAFAASACASAPRDPMQIFFDNTVLVTQPYGETDHLLLSADHTYVMYGIRFPEGRGRWSVENGETCLSPQDTPETTGAKFCNRWSGRGVGDRWTIEVGEVTVPMELVRGRLGALVQDH